MMQIVSIRGINNDSCSVDYGMTQGECFRDDFVPALHKQFEQTIYWEQILSFYWWDGLFYLMGESWEVVEIKAL